MSKKIALIGASIGGMLSALKLSELGDDVYLYEKSSHLAGLYSKVDTPFGTFELGMHVIYVDAKQKEYLKYLFGESYFSEKTEYEVDIGSTYYKNNLNLHSIYPTIVNDNLAEKVLNHISNTNTETMIHPSNIAELLENKFGIDYAKNIAGEILKGLWGIEPKLLTKGALRCFYDFKRVVVADIQKTIELKKSELFDDLIAWPDQKLAQGNLFSGNTAMFMNYSNNHDLDITQKLMDKNINVVLDADIAIKGNKLTNKGVDITDNFDAIIIASPIWTVFQDDKLKCIETRKLSIYYFKLENDISKSLPAYYTLGHDPMVSFARLVNYDAYNFDDNHENLKVIAVEIVYDSEEPDLQKIINDVHQVHHDIKIIDSYKVPYTLSVPIPSIANNLIFEKLINDFKENNNKFIRECGMRPDLGRFFSHNTIGAAFEAILELQ